MQPSDNGVVRAINPRTLLASAAAMAGLPALAEAQGSRTGVDAATWTPDYINNIAGTAAYDTAAECARVVPLNYSGRLT